MRTVSGLEEMVRHQDGLTLLELLLVIVIIGLLMSVAVPSVLRVIDRSEQAVLKKICESCKVRMIANLILEV